MKSSSSTIVFFALHDDFIPQLWTVKRGYWAMFRKYQHQRGLHDTLHLQKPKVKSAVQQAGTTLDHANWMQLT